VPTNTCPRCSEKLQFGKVEGQPIAGCKSCGGIWIGDEPLAMLLKQAPDKLEAADERYPNRLGSGWQSFADKHCPVCNAVLRRMPLAGHPHVFVDRCERGHGLWFDDGELATAAEQHLTHTAKA
jgi:Zn-finger nucleic acid-binding protein